MDNKKIVIIGGGTVYHIRNHLALCAPAYGSTARKLYDMAETLFPKLDRDLYLTRMAGGERWFDGPTKKASKELIQAAPGPIKCEIKLETNEDISKLIDALIDNDKTKIIVMNAALCDWQGQVFDSINGEPEPDKYATRLKTSDGNREIAIWPAEKIVNKIRKRRKDIFLVAFKTTCGATEDEQYVAGLDLCKRASCNLVLANDTKTRLNMVVTPEEARYHVTNDRNKALKGLLEMTALRSHLTFTRSTVVKGEAVPWESELIPDSLRKVVNYCIAKHAYKPFNGSTAGHFAMKLNDTTFLTSIRKTNFNSLNEIGLVQIVTDGPDTVLAYGAKPSVGGQSQRIVFKDHPDYNCIVHFHCPIKPDSQVPTVSQREFECGSHECGNNTSKGLKQFGNLSAVYLDQHGPNIVFHSGIDPNEVIRFIEENFDLSQKTGGFVSIKSRLETPNTLETAKQIL